MIKTSTKKNTLKSAMCIIFRDEYSKSANMMILDKPELNGFEISFPVFDIGDDHYGWEDLNLSQFYLVSIDLIPKGKRKRNIYNIGPQGVDTEFMNRFVINIYEHEKFTLNFNENNYPISRALNDHGFHVLLMNLIEEQNNNEGFNLSSSN